MESVGIIDEKRTVYEQFADMVQFWEGRYEVLLPRKDPLVVLPNNHHLCVKRLYSLLRRLHQTPQLFRQYDDVIRQQIELGILEPVELKLGFPEQTHGQDQLGQGPIHYLLHHAVVKQDNQTTKIRVVYDASARSGGPSLNDCLHVGPKFNQKIMEILLRFRVHDVAVVADIEKAFLMISIDQSDRDALRFLWVSDLDKQPPDICAYWFTRVVFGVACSPFLLNATLSQHVDKYRTTQPNLVNQLQRSIYVDDVVLGAKTAELAHQLCSESRKLLSKGGFNLRKFLTNHEWLRDKLSKEEKSKEGRQSETYTSTMLGKSQAPLHRERKVQRVRWNTVTDELVLSSGE